MYLEHQEEMHKKRRAKRDQVKNRIKTAFKGQQNEISAEEQQKPQATAKPKKPAAAAKESRYDTLITVDTAKIQHGENNKRVYLMDIGKAEPGRLIKRLTEIAEAHHYEKVFAKIPVTAADEFLQAGYITEARVPGLFAGKTDGLFLSRYLHPERAEEPIARHYQMVSSLARSKEDSNPPNLPEGTTTRLCTASDAPAMAKLYKQVFASYPFPIDDPAFIRKSMREGTIFAGIEENGHLIALASAECSLHPERLYAEMTDFATLPKKRGGGYATHLLYFLEKEAAAKGIQTAYTIARAVSVGMNITFSRAGYQYAGRLKNNTDIDGKIESMNVWYKHLS
ncbi:MAG: putative beta-lysine N-acetyltransferase [Spirochaetota bacterium]